MENLKHTHGEWVANPHGANRHQVWCNGTKIAACDNSVQSEIYREKSEAEMAANAKLIAAAPELLEALIELDKLVFSLNIKVDGLTALALQACRERVYKSINKAIGE